MQPRQQATERRPCAAATMPARRTTAHEGADLVRLSETRGTPLEFTTPKPRTRCERRRSMKSRSMLRVFCLALILFNGGGALRAEAARVRPAAAPVAPPPCFIRLAG